MSLGPLIFASRGLYGFEISVCIVNEDPRSNRKLTRKATERTAFGSERCACCAILFKAVECALDSLVVTFLYLFSVPSGVDLIDYRF